MDKPVMEPQWLTPEEIGALSDRDLKRFHRLCRRMLLLARVVRKPSELSPDDLATMVSLRDQVSSQLGLIVVEQYCRRWAGGLVDLKSWSDRAWDELDT